MMEPNKPISYDSRKSIFPFLEPNKRFEIIARLPSLQNLDRITPLKIDRLIFHPTGLTVNGTVYEIGIIQKNRGDTPDYFKNINEKGGIYYDIDRFGLEDLRAQRAITPGDLQLSAISGRTIPLNDFDVQERERNIANQRVQASRLQAGSKGQKLVMRRLETMERQVLPYQCRKNNVNSPFNRYLQLTIRTGSGEPYVERVEYNKKLPFALKNLNTKLFASRRDLTKVKFLDVSSSGNLPVIRLPENLRFEVTKLSVSNRDDMEIPAITNIINGSRVDELVCTHIREATLRSEILQNARSLKFLDIGDNWLTVMQRLNNQEISLQENGRNADDYINLMRFWIEHGKPFGTTVTVEIRSVEREKEMKARIEAEFGGFSVLMRNMCMLHVTFKERPDQDDDVESGWMKMEVVH